jgi:hypothetical protein
MPWGENIDESRIRAKKAHMPAAALLKGSLVQSALRKRSKAVQSTCRPIGEVIADMPPHRPDRTPREKSLAVNRGIARPQPSFRDIDPQSRCVHIALRAPEHFAVPIVVLMT